MEVFDKDGNPVEGVFTQAELDAKIEEAKKAFTPVASTETPVVDPTKVTATPALDPIITSLQEQVAALATGFQSSVTSKFATGLDAVSYTHLTLPTKPMMCRSRWSPYH